MNKGITLIETLIYIALFIIIMGGALFASYSIILSQESNKNKIILQEEANFIYRKFTWALNGSVISQISTTTLKLIKNSGEQINFSYESPYLYIEILPEGRLPLNSGVVSVSDVEFRKTTEFGYPDRISIDFILTVFDGGRSSSENFSFWKYLRQ
ncbi:MAG TPA: hypothetical protein VJC12_01940 [Candidatus Paceibacterota bacterium]